MLRIISTVHSDDEPSRERMICTLNTWKRMVIKNRRDTSILQLFKSSFLLALSVRTASERISGNAQGGVYLHEDRIRSGDRQEPR